MPKKLTERRWIIQRWQHDLLCTDDERVVRTVVAYLRHRESWHRAERRRLRKRGESLTVSEVHADHAVRFARLARLIETGGE